MRRLMRPALLLLLVAIATLPAIADKAKRPLRQRSGRRGSPAVRSGLWLLTSSAYDLKPKDLRYRAAFRTHPF